MMKYTLICFVSSHQNSWISWPLAFFFQSVDHDPNDLPLRYFNSYLTSFTYEAFRNAFIGEVYFLNTSSDVAITQRKRLETFSDVY